MTDIDAIIAEVRHRFVSLANEEAWWLAKRAVLLADEVERLQAEYRDLDSSYAELQEEVEQYRNLMRKANA